MRVLSLSYIPVMFCLQRGKKHKLTSILWKMPDVNGSISDLRSDFTIQLDHLHCDDALEEFAAVIGQDGQLIHVGDYVEIIHQEVRNNTFLASIAMSFHYIIDKIWDSRGLL